MRFFYILEYIWVFVILASGGRAVVVFSVVTNQTGDLNLGAIRRKIGAEII